MVHLAVREAKCPNCGGPIELALGSSAACVCPYCRYSVVRRDVDLAVYGKVADLVPSTPILAPGDVAIVEGRELVVGGRLQLDHGRGPWDEFFVELRPEGRWGWLAAAQGFYYLTFPAQASGLPTYEQLSPGAQGVLPGAGDVTWTVAERGESRLISAEGELPYPVRGGERGRYVDLHGPEGRFATVDFGDGLEPPVLYAGRMIAAKDVALHRNGPRAVEVVQGAKLGCPGCGAPVPIAVPESCESAVCASCHSLLDYEAGALALLSKLDQKLTQLRIPLGTKGTLAGESVLVIGFMERSVRDDTGYYRWAEYLLHTPNGYRWLTEDNGHFVFFRPVSVADVTFAFGVPSYAGRRYRPFQRSVGKVESAVGEFYFRVQRGETAELSDFVAPPRVLSREASHGEVIWSEGEYLEGAAVWSGLGLAGRAPATIGVAPSQPNPHRLLPASLTALALVLLLCVASGLADVGRSTSVLVDGPVALAATPGDPLDPSTALLRTPPFRIDGNGPTPVRIDLSTNTDNQWVGVSCALVDQATFEETDFFVEAGYYHGVEGGESWTEGSTSTTEYLSAIRPGTYVLEMLPSWQSFPQSGAYAFGSVPTASMKLTTGERSPLCGFLSLVLLLVPLGLVVFRRFNFEQKRKEGSNLS